MANTFILIGSTTVGSGGATNINFTSIPATYTDLLLIASLRNTDSASSLALAITINGSTANFSNVYLSGGGSGGTSTGTSGRYIGEYNAATSTASTFTSLKVYIPNYLSSLNKSMSVDSAQEDDASVAYLTSSSNLWSDSSAITSIGLTRLANGIGNFAQYSTAYLYGISNA